VLFGLYILAWPFSRSFKYVFFFLFLMISVYQGLLYLRKKLPAGSEFPREGKDQDSTD
jgi:hypothetical protein